MESEQDDQLIRRTLEGDERAFEALLERYESYVFRLIHMRVPKNDVQMLAHESFVEAYYSLKGLRDPAMFRGWLSSIAIRKCCAYWREAYRNKRVTPTDLNSDTQLWLQEAAAQAGEIQFQEAADKANAREVVALILDKLSPSDRVLITMLYLEERSLKEAAELMNWSLTNTKVRAHRAKSKLRKALEELQKE